MPKKTTTLCITLTQHFDIDVESSDNLNINALNKTVEAEIQQLIQSGNGIDYEWHEKEENT